MSGPSTGDEGEPADLGPEEGADIPPPRGTKDLSGSDPFDPAGPSDRDAVESPEDTEELEVPEPPLTGAGEERAVPQPRSAWPIWAWMMVGVVMLVLAVGVVGGVLLASVILDILSFWPGFLVTFLLAAALWPMSRRFSSRLKATVPLLVLTWLGLAVALHLAGWSELPSSAGDLSGGPVDGIETGSISFESDGSLALTSANQPELYRVNMLRRGGPVGAPQALETMPAGSVAVDIVERAPSTWYSAAGWDVVLADQIPWSMEVTAASLDLDLTMLSLAEASFLGAGLIELGEIEAGTTIRLAGSIELIVPPDAAVVVSGSAVVPSDWIATETGSTSPAIGDPYNVVVLEGANVSISER